MTETVFNPRVIHVEKPSHHYSLLVAPDGDWLSTSDGSTLTVQGHVDDGAIWDKTDDGFRHVVSGLTLGATDTTTDATCQLRVGDDAVDAAGREGESVDFTVRHGPEKLPSDYLRTLHSQGWVCLTAILSPSIVDGLEKVGCTGPYSDRTPERQYPLAQDAAIARATTEPTSLWLTRQYMRTSDIRLGHSPGVSALSPDDGEREVQGWHTDFPYLWGIPASVQGERIPVGSGGLVLGMQRNVCVSQFTKDNGATVFKLGTHALDRGPPEEWGTTTDTSKRGYRAEHGLPYGDRDTDVLEAPAGSIMLYDARTWHRAGVNRTDQRRGAMIQAIVPSYIIPFMDTSATFKAFLESSVYLEVTERERKELDQLMVHKIVGPAGQFAISVDRELTERVHDQLTESA